MGNSRSHNASSASTRFVWCPKPLMGYEDGHRQSFTVIIQEIVAPVVWEPKILQKELSFKCLLKPLRAAQICLALAKISAIWDLPAIQGLQDIEIKGLLQAAVKHRAKHVSIEYCYCIQRATHLVETNWLRKQNSTSNAILWIDLGEGRKDDGLVPNDIWKVTTYSAELSWEFGNCSKIRQSRAVNFAIRRITYDHGAWSPRRRTCGKLLATWLLGKVRTTDYLLLC